MQEIFTLKYIRFFWLSSISKLFLIDPTRPVRLWRKSERSEVLSEVWGEPVLQRKDLFHVRRLYVYLRHYF